MREGRRGAARGATTVLLGVAKLAVSFARARRQGAPAGEEDANDAGGASWSRAPGEEDADDAGL